MKPGLVFVASSSETRPGFLSVRELYGVARIVGLDVGERRIGVAISDATCTLARPLTALRTTGLDGNALEVTTAEIARLSREEDGLAGVVVGLPRHLDGTPSRMTARVERFGARLRARTELPVMFQDERLSSREAESRLAAREKNWRARKDRLDAVAAAVVLQDYLESRPVVRPAVIGDDPYFP
jgi:putative holliday junction resolvase